MDFRSFFGRALSSGVKVVTDAGARAITGPVKDISGTAKDVTGIRKDLVETKLAQFDVEEHESLIQKATLEDVKKYDPKTQRVIERAIAVKEWCTVTEMRHETKAVPSLWLIVLWGSALASAFACCYFLWGPTLRSVFKWVGIGLGCLVCLLILWSVWDLIWMRRRDH